MAEKKRGLFVSFKIWGDDPDEVIDARSLNCVLPAGHQGLHESYDGDTIWREKVLRDVFKREK